MDGTAGVMKLLNSMEIRMQTPNNSPEIEYDKVDPEEIIIKLREVLAFIQKKKQEGKL